MRLFELVNKYRELNLPTVVKTCCQNKILLLFSIRLQFDVHVYTGNVLNEIEYDKYAILECNFVEQIKT